MSKSHIIYLKKIDKSEIYIKNYFFNNKHHFFNKSVHNFIHTLKLYLNITIPLITYFNFFYIIVWLTRYGKKFTMSKA